MLSQQERNWCSADHVLLSSRPLYRAARSLHNLITAGPYPVRLGAFQGFVVHGQPLDGLTTQLAQLFHPVPLDISTGGLATGGSSRGMRVDAQLAALVNTSSLSTASTGGAGGVPPLHDYTARIVRRLRELGLRPFMAQAPVGSVPLRLATALDLLCVDERRDGALVNVQIKTGFERRENYSRQQPGAYFTNTSAPVPDSHEMRHLLQVMAEHLIVQTAYGHPLAYSMLMVVSASQITTRCLPDPSIPIRPADVARALENRLRSDAPPPVEAEVAAVRARHAARAVRRIVRQQRRGRGRGRYSN